MIKVFVLYDRSGIHSGRSLGKYLSAKFGSKANIQRGRPATLATLARQGAKFDYVVNVGWYKDVPNTGAIILNPPSSVARSSNKRRARIVFRDEKVPAPKLWLSPGEVKQGDLPVIARTTHHTKGRGLWYCRTLADVRSASKHQVRTVMKLIRTRKNNLVRRPRKIESPGATHYLKFIPNTREFRVHVMSPRPDMEDLKAEDFVVIKLSEKIPAAGAKTNEIVKSHDNGWFFGYPKDRKDPALPLIREVARKSIQVLGLHWGAVDIMISKDTGAAYVLEVNSTPCLTDDNANTLEKYGTSIGSLLGLAPSMERKKPIKKVVSKRKSPVNKKRLLKSFLKRQRL